MIFSIENGDFLSFISYIVIEPSLLYSIDEGKNNLLHIAAKKDEADIYEIILKKSGSEMLKQKNKVLLYLYRTEKLHLRSQNYSYQEKF